MNHGIVCFQGDLVASTIWKRAMGRSQFVAIYATRMLEGYGPGRDFGASWKSAFVHSVGEPAVLDPGGFGQRPGFRHPTGEYARYEPGYDLQFCGMVEGCAGELLSVAVPASVDDEEALRLLGEMALAEQELCERFWDQPHEKRNKCERRLRDVAGLIALREEWAFYMFKFSRYSPAAIFLSDSQSDVEAFAAAVANNGKPDDIVEKW
ncbi:MAG TPA: hypothetical protein VGH74_18675 [Planctomycetaceae bacterium]|jgi:hypothetical protein